MISKISNKERDEIFRNLKIYGYRNIKKTIKKKKKKKKM